MWDVNLARNQAVTMDTQDDVQDDVWKFIAVSPSGKMVVTESIRSVEFWDTTTWEVIRRMDSKFGMKIAFSPDENQVAVLSKSLLTLWDINNPENRLSFEPWPTGRDVRDWQVAFQTSDHVVICAKLWTLDLVSYGLLQVWHVTGPTRLFSLDIEIPKYSDLFLAPDGLTVAISICGSYYWDHGTGQFHFTSQEYLYGYPRVYTPDGRFLACRSHRDDQLSRDDDDDSNGLLQVRHVTGPTRSLDIKIINSDLSLAPNGLTVISKYGSYSWNHDTAQFDPFHFTDQEHLNRCMYSPDGKLVASRSPKDNGVRVWDTRTGQLCGNPITMPNYADPMVLSPALNNQSIGSQLIAIHCWDTNTTSLFDVDTGHLYAEFWSQGGDMAFIRDGTRLMTSARPLIIRDTADLVAKHRDGSKLHPRNMTDGWMIGQDNESLFWVPVEHREDLCLLPQFEMTWGQPTKLNLSNFRYGNEWTECIDQEWLEELEDKEKKMGRLLG